MRKSRQQVYRQAQEVPEVPEELATALERLEIEYNMQPADTGNVVREHRPLTSVFTVK